MRVSYPVRALAAVVGLAVLGIGAGAVGPARGADTPPAETLTIGVNDFPGSFNPLFDASGIRSYIGWMVQRPMTAYDADWALVCVLCTELPTRENGRIRDETLPDGRSAVAVRYTIRPGASWGDGQPVTARDVRFTWTVGRTPEVPVLDRQLFADEILDIKVVDDRTFVVYRAPTSCNPSELGSLVLLPEHLERQGFERNPAGYRVASRFDTDSTAPGLWYGPYRVSVVVPGELVVLDRNPEWYGATPFFDRIVVKSFANSADLEKALLSGSVDYVSGEYGFSVHQAAQLERRQGDRFRVVWQPGLAYRHLDVNHDNPALADVRVRRALLHALNRELINDRLYYGRNQLAHTETHPKNGMHDPTVRTYAFDPAEAGRLLDEAGWRLGADGLRRDGTGKPLEVSIWAGAGDRTIDLELQLIQDSWSRVGVTTLARQAPASVLFGEVLGERQFDGLALFSWISAPGQSPRSNLHSSQVPTADNGWSGQNYLGYRNAEMDRLLNDIDHVCEPAANRAAWSRLQHLYAQDLPALPIFFMSQAFFFPPWLQGVVPTGHQFESSMGVEHWVREEPRN